MSTIIWWWMMTVLLIATEFVRTTLPEIPWQPKMWTTRDANPFKKATVFYALHESVPEGFTADLKHNWLVEGKEMEAYFTGDILKAWHSERRGTGQLSRKPHIIWGERRELTVYEKLAAQAQPSSVIPPVRRAGSLNLKSQTAQQLCRDEIRELMARFVEEERQDKAGYVERRGKREAAYRAEAVEVFRSYGVNPFPIVFPP